MRKFAKVLFIIALAMCLVIFAYGYIIATRPFTPDGLSVVIAMERIIQHGEVGKITIYGNGQVACGENPIWNFKTIRISDDGIKKLIFDFGDADFYSMSEKYDEATMTDYPLVITSISIGGRRKTVTHNYADPNAPEKLMKLEDDIYNIGRLCQ